MSPFEVFIQQCLTGLSNGMIIALIALGYTMVYGIIELINFAHGDLFMLGAFCALTLLGLLGVPSTDTLDANAIMSLILMLVVVGTFCACFNWLIDRLAYAPLRKAPRLAPLVSAIGVSFVLMNIGLLWGGLPMEVFGNGRAAAAPKDFPGVIPNLNLLGDSPIQYTVKDLVVILCAVPMMIGLTLFVSRTKTGKAMRAVAQNPDAAQLMGIDVDRIIGITFLIGGALAGVASVIYATYNGTIYFQMGFRVGVDAFTAAVLGGIGNIPGAMLGGIAIGLIRAMSDQYIASQWTNVVVFSILILVLVFKPSGLLGTTIREKV